MSVLADDFFRLAHNDTTGKPLLHSQAMGLGLAAALLGELLGEQKIYLRQGRLYGWQSGPPSDALTHAVLDQIQAQPSHTEVSTWLKFLAVNAYEDVAVRLWKAGHLRPVSTRRLLRQTQTTWVPTNLITAARPRLTLAAVLSRGAAVRWDQGVLLCLAAATDLDIHLLRDLPAAAGDHLARLCGSAPQDVRELAAIPAAAVAEAVLSYRT